MADFKALPYRAEKELHKAGDQNWVILGSNEKGKGYEKPELINLDGSKSITGYVDGDSHFLLFQGNDNLVNNTNKPVLAKASFAKLIGDGKWETEEVAAKAWLDAYEASNKWVALGCDFPILKALAKWLHTNKTIISELIYLKITEVDEDKLFSALSACKTAFLEGEDFEENEDSYNYLKKFGLESIEFLEKEPKVKSKALPLVGIKKGEDGLLTYEKPLFTTPTKAASTGGGKGYQSQSQMASSRLEFLLSSAEKIQQLVNLYPSAELLSVGLALAGVELDPKWLTGLYVAEKPQSIAEKLHTIGGTYFKPEISEEKPKEDLKELIQVFGETKTNKWIEQLDALVSTGNPVDLGIGVLAMKQIINSPVWESESKNVLLWCKEHLTQTAVKSLLDLKYEHLLTISNAVKTVENLLTNKSDTSILDLKPDDIDIPAF